jgi:hypothetical protein
MKKQDLKLFIEGYLLAMLITVNYGLKSLSPNDRTIFFLSFILILVNSLILLVKFQLLTRELLREIVTTVFQISLIIFLILLLATQFRSEIREYINFTYFLAVIIVLGLYVFFQSEKRRVQETEIQKTDYYFIFLCGVAGVAVVWYKVKDLGALSYLIALLSGVLIVSLSILLLKEERPTPQESVEAMEKPTTLKITPPPTPTQPLLTKKPHVQTKEERIQAEFDKIATVERLWKKFVSKLDTFTADLEKAEPEEYFELYARHTKLVDFYKAVIERFGEYISGEERATILKKFHYCSSVLADLLERL